MWNYGLAGLVIGFVLGMVVNAILLRNTPKADYLKNKDLRTRYGLLNWAIVLAGMAIGLYLSR